MLSNIKSLIPHLDSFAQPFSGVDNNYIQGNTSEGIAIVQGLKQQPQQQQPSLPNLSVSGELPDVDNLSSNLDSIKLASKEKKSEFQHQSLQLDTPENSEMSLANNEGVIMRSQRSK